MGWKSHGLAFAVVAVLFCHFSLVRFAQAQSANATTDPSEGNLTAFFFSFWDKFFLLQNFMQRYYCQSMVSSWESQQRNFYFDIKILLFF